MQPAIKKLDHLVITTEDMDACIAFYRALGFDARDEGGRYAFYAGDFKINVHYRGRELQPCAGHVQCGSADLCFELDMPIADFARQLDARGLSAELGVVARHGVRGDMQSVYLRDPDGNLLEFCSYE